MTEKWLCLTQNSHQCDEPEGYEGRKRGMLRILLGAEVRVGGRKFTFVINCDAYGSKKARFAGQREGQQW